MRFHNFIPFVLIVLIGCNHSSQQTNTKENLTCKYFPLSCIVADFTLEYENNPSETWCIKSMNLSTGMNKADYSYGHWAINALGITKKSVFEFVVVPYTDDIFLSPQDRADWLEAGAFEYAFQSEEGGYAVYYNGRDSLQVDSSPAIALDFSDEEGRNEAIKFVNSLQKADCSAHMAPTEPASLLYTHRGSTKQFCLTPDDPYSIGIRRPPCLPN